MRPRKKVKLQDIADEVGVSVVTVSNALADRGGVSDELRAKVRETAEKLGYQPAQTAVRRRREEIQIGLLYTEKARNSEMCIDFEKLFAWEAEKKGMKLTEAVLQEKSGRIIPEQALQPVRALLLLTAPREDSAARFLAQCHIPCVLLGDMPDMQADCITFDAFRGMRDLTLALIQAGCRRIGFVGPLRNNITALDQFLGCCAALEQAGIPDNGSFYYDAERGTEAAAADWWQNRTQVEFQSLKRLHRPLPDAFVCCRTETKDNLLRQLKKKGLRVPEDVIVTGFTLTAVGDSSEAELRGPVLCSRIRAVSSGAEDSAPAVAAEKRKPEEIRFFLSDLAREAAEILYAKTRGETKQGMLHMVEGTVIFEEEN